jgi:hypothetical protein
LKAELYHDAVLARLGEQVVEFAERLDGKWACRFEEYLEDAGPMALDKRIGTPCTAHAIFPPLPVRPRRGLPGIDMVQPGTPVFNLWLAAGDSQSHPASWAIVGPSPASRVCLISRTSFGSNRRPRYIVERLSHMTRSLTRQT